MVRYWVRQLSVVINRTASRSILAAAANLVNRDNFCQTVIFSSEQCDHQYAANSDEALDFIHNFDLSLMNQERIQT